MTLGWPLVTESSANGLPALEQRYGFLPAKVQTITVGEQYAALSAGDVQAAYVNTTDGQLAGRGPAYVVLGDPHHVLGFGNVVPVMTKTAYAAEGPVFAADRQRDRLAADDERDARAQRRGRPRPRDADRGRQAVPGAARAPPPVGAGAVARLRHPVEPSPPVPRLESARSVDLDDGRRLDRDEDELGDPVPGRRPDARCPPVGVEQQHDQLTRDSPRRSVRGR